MSLYRRNDLIKLKQEIDKLNIPYMKRKWDKIPNN
jgi:hypothetical protein